MASKYIQQKHLDIALEMAMHLNPAKSSQNITIPFTSETSEKQEK